MSCLSRRSLLGSAGAALALSPLSSIPATARTVSPRAHVSLHQKLICLDTHLDTPANLVRPGWDVMARHKFDDDLSQVDYPRMVEGGLDGGFWAIYTPQGPLSEDGMRTARDTALMRGLAIREMIARHPGQFELATQPSDAARIAAKGKRIVYMSIENSYPLGPDPSLLSAFHAMGVRLAGIVHMANNQFADSSTDPNGKTWKGLSPAGKQWLSLANDLGIVADASHASDDVFDQMLELSRSPILLSHSACKAICDHPRNLDDARMKKLAEKGGVIQINSLSQYVIATPENPERDKAEAALFAPLRDIPKMSPAEATSRIRQLARALKELDRKYAEPRASFDDFMRHVRHALDLVGPDHVGIGCDWDGGGGVTGMEDVAGIPKITDALFKTGCSGSDLAKIWGGNALRVLGEAQKNA